MKDQSKTKQALIQELASLRQRISELERSESERKQAEEILQKSEKRYHLLFDAVPVGIGITDSEGTVYAINLKGQEITGYAPEEFKVIKIGDTYVDFDERKQMLEVLRESGQVRDYEVRLRRKDGTVFPALLNIDPIEMEGRRVFLTAIRDITEFKKKHKEIEHLSSFPQLTPVMILEVGKDKEVIFCNPAMQSILDKMSIEDPRIFISEDIWELFNSTAITIKSEYVRELQINDTAFHENIYFTPEFKSLRVYAIDITERKRAEEALRERDIQLKKLTSWLPGMIYQFTKKPDGTYFVPFTTEAIKDIFGCSPQDVREDFSPIARIILPEDFDKVVGSIEYSAKHLTIWTCEYRVQIPGQSIRWILGKSTPEKLADGSITWYGFNTDITERKQIVDALAKSEALLREAQGVAHIGHWELDTSTMTPAWSEEIFHIFGFDPEEGEPSFKAHQEVTHPDDWGILNNAVTTSIAEGIPFDIEFRILLPDKTIRWMHAIGYPKKDSEGRIISVFGTAQDITDRKLMEDALRVSREKYRVLFESFPFGITISDKSGKIIEGNRQSEQMLGIAREAHAQRRIDSKEWQIIRKDGTPMPADEYASTRALRENRLIENVEMGIVKDKGEITWISVTAAPIPLEGHGVAIAYSDITERLSAEQAGKRAEDDLRRSEENFRRSLDDSPLGVRIVTEDGETIYANRAILDINDCDSLEELNATPVEKRYTPESFAEHQIRKEKRKRGDYDPSEYEVSIIRKDGEVRQLQVFRKEVLWNGERQFQVLYQDITERKQAEEALRASRKQMQALAGHLQEVREEERTNIAREIHDELGGALTGMKVDVSFLIKSALKIKNEATRTSLLAGMDSVTKSIDTTIQTVRRIAMELRPGILDDLGLVAALEWQLKDFEKRTGIRCEFFPPAEDIDLDADVSTALFRIFQEALTNVTRHSGATEVCVRLRADADSSTLEVEDNGKGIEKEKIHSSKSLGLLGMRERAQMFGGRITVTGPPGAGTTVTIDIPPSSTTSLLAAGKFISLADLE